MKTFYDLTVFDTANKLTVVVELVKHHDPQFTFTINDIPVTDTAKFDLLDNLVFKCTVSTGAIEIAKITINQKEIMPVYLHLANPATNWVTDYWELTILQPFYPWYHQITGQGWIA